MANKGNSKSNTNTNTNTSTNVNNETKVINGYPNAVAATHAEQCAPSDIVLSMVTTKNERVALVHLLFAAMGGNNSLECRYAIGLSGALINLKTGQPTSEANCKFDGKVWHAVAGTSYAQQVHWSLPYNNADGGRYSQASKCAWQSVLRVGRTHGEALQEVADAIVKRYESMATKLDRKKAEPKALAAFAESLEKKLVGNG